MMIKTFFSNTKNILARTSLQLTKPCAVIPVLLASFGFLNQKDGFLFFNGEITLFAAIYGLYAAGILLSWIDHRRLLPVLFLAIHLLLVFISTSYLEYEWQALGALLTLLLTSQVNQFYLQGSGECNNNSCCG